MGSEIGATGRDRDVVVAFKDKAISGDARRIIMDTLCRWVQNGGALVLDGGCEIMMMRVRDHVMMHPRYSLIGVDELPDSTGSCWPTLSADEQSQPCKCRKPERRTGHEG